MQGVSTLPLGKSESKPTHSAPPIQYTSRARCRKVCGEDLVDVTYAFDVPTRSGIHDVEYPPSHSETERHHTMSEGTAQRVDDEIRTVVMNGYERAKGLIDRNKPAVEMVAQMLLDQESIEAHEIADIMKRSGADIR